MKKIIPCLAILCFLAACSCDCENVKELRKKEYANKLHQNATDLTNSKHGFDVFTNNFEYLYNTELEIAPDGKGYRSFVDTVLFKYMVHYVDTAKELAERVDILQQQRFRLILQNDTYQALVEDSLMNMYMYKPTCSYMRARLMYDSIGLSILRLALKNESIPYSCCIKSDLVALQLDTLEKQL